MIEKRCENCGVTVVTDSGSCRVCGGNMNPVASPSAQTALDQYKPGPLRLAFIRGINSGLPFDLPREEAMKAARLAYPDSPVTEPRLVQSDASRTADARPAQEERT